MTPQEAPRANRIVDPEVQILVFSELLSQEEGEKPIFCIAVDRVDRLADPSREVMQKVTALGHAVLSHRVCRERWVRQEGEGVEGPILFVVESASYAQGVLIVSFSRSSGVAFRHGLGLGDTGGTCRMARIDGVWQLQQCRYEWIS
jgi:hypothetical protein